MPRTAERIYMASDLSTSARREFIEEGRQGFARLRTTAGDSLVLLREARLEHLSSIRDHALAYLLLDAALRRPREERRPQDFGPWAFIEVFEDDDIIDFQSEVNDAITRAASGGDAEGIESVLDAWRRSARTLSDPVAREILSGQVSAEDWVEVTEAPLDAPHD
ncbi:hypothetical protein GUY44_24235 [Pimelobacter simplex]|uniref:hypothetical protein n=1 Tax=Nocardioides simplex TaxID=2045 RepID=UPI000536157D|nr:hypothetical protein [Pimelobacter simplex]MCG8153608.1 hypothetical protein [Pimelobacter simplex]GEB17078.1 hypothetical protein NSI01_53930 [Pimelobacter simplex]SFN07797.1 hypothetical protein SAMN05421671_4967 [Pimelobacter simplex]